MKYSAVLVWMVLSSAAAYAGPLDPEPVCETVHLEGDAYARGISSTGGWLCICHHESPGNGSRLYAWEDIPPASCSQDCADMAPPNWTTSSQLIWAPSGPLLACALSRYSLANDTLSCPDGMQKVGHPYYEEERELIGTTSVQCTVTMYQECCEDPQ